MVERVGAVCAEPRRRASGRPCAQQGEAVGILNEPDVVDEHVGTAATVDERVLEHPEDSTVGQDERTLIVGAGDPGHVVMGEQRSECLRASSRGARPSESLSGNNTVGRDAGQENERAEVEARAPTHDRSPDVRDEGSAPLRPRGGGRQSFNAAAECRHPRVASTGVRDATKELDPCPADRSCRSQHRRLLRNRSGLLRCSKGAPRAWAATMARESDVAGEMERKKWPIQQATAMVTKWAAHPSCRPTSPRHTGSRHWRGAPYDWALR